MYLKDIESTVFNILTPLGFECYAFKVGWYNDKVGSEFQLEYERDTLAFIIVSTPAMFDKAFKPFICRRDCSEDAGRDLIDECIAEHFQNIQRMFPESEVECIHDFELHHSRRPKILVQTAGHVAGAAYYYQRKDVVVDPWPLNQKISGVSIHPRYGGWFALRGVIIFRNVSVPELEPRPPPDVVCGDEKRIELLERFNFNWKDWTYRDVVKTEDVYSEQQKEYFITPPKQRGPLIERIRAEMTSNTKSLCQGV